MRERERSKHYYNFPVETAKIRRAKNSQILGFFVGLFPFQVKNLKEKKMEATLKMGYMIEGPLLLYIYTHTMIKFFLFLMSIYMVPLRLTSDDC
jgi:hypothetical protein